MPTEKTFQLTITHDKKDKLSIKKGAPDDNDNGKVIFLEINEKEIHQKLTTKLTTIIEKELQNFSPNPTYRSISHSEYFFNNKEIFNKIADDIYQNCLLCHEPLSGKLDVYSFELANDVSTVLTTQLNDSKTKQDKLKHQLTRADEIAKAMKLLIENNSFLQSEENKQTLRIIELFKNKVIEAINEPHKNYNLNCTKSPVIEKSFEKIEAFYSQKNLMEAQVHSVNLQRTHINNTLTLLDQSICLTDRLQMVDASIDTAIKEDYVFLALKEQKKQLEEKLTSLQEPSQATIEANRALVNQAENSLIKNWIDQLNNYQHQAIGTILQPLRTRIDHLTGTMSSNPQQSYLKGQAAYLAASQLLQETQHTPGTGSTHLQASAITDTNDTISARLASLDKKISNTEKRKQTVRSWLEQLATVETCYQEKKATQDQLKNRCAELLNQITSSIRLLQRLIPTIAASYESIKNELVNFQTTLELDSSSDQQKILAELSSRFQIANNQQQAAGLKQLQQKLSALLEKIKAHKQSLVPSETTNWKAKLTSYLFPGLSKQKYQLDKAAIDILGQLRSALQNQPENKITDLNACLTKAKGLFNDEIHTRYRGFHFFKSIITVTSQNIAADGRSLMDDLQDSLAVYTARPCAPIRAALVTGQT